MDTFAILLLGGTCAIWAAMLSVVVAHAKHRHDG
jgi:hypothetical protein